MGIAGSFTGGFIAQDAPLSTSVSNVGSHTPLPSAHNQSQHPVKGKSMLFQPVEALPTPVKVERLAFYLEGYEAHLYQELILGFVQGFRLYFEGPKVGQFSKNLLSAMQHPDIVDSKLTKEIHEGRIRGPFEHPPFDNFKVSPLGVIPKKQLGEYRMIHHLSFPYGGSVNDFIPSEFCLVHYASFGGCQNDKEVRNGLHFGQD